MRVASVARVANTATLLAIGTADTVFPRKLPNGEFVAVYRVRVERAWRWPGSDSLPPRWIEVTDLDWTTCSGYVGSDEPYVVQASHVAMRTSPSDTVLSLAGRCSLEGPADTAGAFGDTLRARYGEAAYRRWASRRAAELDSIRLALGAGVVPAP